METIYFATMEEMLNFSDLLRKLELKFFHLGAIKIVPPQEWRLLINFTETSDHFDKTICAPKYQLCCKLAEGIFQLANNPQSDKMLTMETTKESCSGPKKDCPKKGRPPKKGRSEKACEQFKDNMLLEVKQYIHFCKIILTVGQYVSVCAVPSFQYLSTYEYKVKFKNPSISDFDFGLDIFF